MVAQILNDFFRILNQPLDGEGFGFIFFRIIAFPGLPLVPLHDGKVIFPGALYGVHKTDIGKSRPAV